MDLPLGKILLSRYTLRVYFCDSAIYVAPLVLRLYHSAHTNNLAKVQSGKRSRDNNRVFIIKEMTCLMSCKFFRFVIFSSRLPPTSITLSLPCRLPSLSSRVV